MWVFLQLQDLGNFSASHHSVTAGAFDAAAKFGLDDSLAVGTADLFLHLVSPADLQ